MYLKSVFNVGPHLINHLEEGCLIKRRCVRHIPPLFGGHPRTTPQGMVPDVQPLVKSSLGEKMIPQ